MAGAMDAPAGTAEGSRPLRIAVIGAGIAGLSAAKRLKERGLWRGLASDVQASVCPNKQDASSSFHVLLNVPASS